MTNAAGTSQLYFAGKRFAEWGSGGCFHRAALDRLASTNASTYYPCGHEKQTSTQNAENFATYYRGGAGLDYADQRYYSSIMGTFLTPDPDDSINSTEKPQNWNRYAYVKNDPVNSTDPTGLCSVEIAYFPFIRFPGDPTYWFGPCLPEPVGPVCCSVLGCYGGGGFLLLAPPDPITAIKQLTRIIAGPIAAIIGILLNPRPTGGRDDDRCDQQYDDDIKLCKAWYLYDPRNRRNRSAYLAYIQHAATRRDLCRPGHSIPPLQPNPNIQ